MSKSQSSRVLHITNIHINNRGFLPKQAKYTKRTKELLTAVPLRYNILTQPNTTCIFGTEWPQSNAMVTSHQPNLRFALLKLRFPLHHACLRGWLSWHIQTLGQLSELYLPVIHPTYVTDIRPKICIDLRRFGSRSLPIFCNLSSELCSIFLKTLNRWSITIISPLARRVCQRNEDR